MPYISERGVISNSRPLWRLSTITDFFWGALNVAYLFLRTLIEPSLTSEQMSSSGRRGGGGGRGQGPPRPPKPRFGGFPSTSACPPGAPPMMGGG